jgi:pentatricopeptide repeat protein
MVDLGVEIPSRCQQMLLKWAHPQTEATQPFSLIDEDRGGSGVEAVAAWKMMFKEDPEAGKGIDQEKRPAYETLLKKDLEPETFKRLASRSFAASRNLALQISSSVRHQSRSSKPSATATQSSFPSSFRSSQSPIRSHAYSTTTTFLPPRNPNQTQRRSYSSVVSNLPSILASSSPDVQLDTQAFNSLLYAFASDDNVRLTIPLEAYVALRRHAAGVRWRAPYIEKASLGLYHNYDDATESYANPILDSLSYDLPVGLKPDRQTYSIMLKSCIMRGDLSLALTVFKDMLNPNSNALRMENSPPGPAGAPPVKLDVFPPGLPEYTVRFLSFSSLLSIRARKLILPCLPSFSQTFLSSRCIPTQFFFQGFFEYGEVPGMREDDERVYDTWSKKVVRVGGEDRQEALEVMEEELDAAAEEGKGTRRKGERLSKRELEIRERTTWLWMTGMGFWEGPTGDEADGVQFTGEVRRSGKPLLRLSFFVWH